MKRRIAILFHEKQRGWLRSGNTGAARGVVPFLQEALALSPEGMWIRTVRADRGFFEEGLLAFLEERALPYVVVARLTSTLKCKCAGIKEWTPMDEHHAAGDFTVKLFGWSKERRFVVVRGWTGGPCPGAARLARLPEKPVHPGLPGGQVHPAQLALRLSLLHEL